MYEDTLTLNQVDDILYKVEDILISPKLKFGYDLDDLLPYSRIDVIHAFMIQIARGIIVGENDSEISELLNSMIIARIKILSMGIPNFELNDSETNSQVISLMELSEKYSLLGTKDEGVQILIENLQEQRKYIQGLENLPSFKSFCNVLKNSKEKEYWHEVYKRIGLVNNNINKNKAKELKDKDNVNFDSLRKTNLSRSKFYRFLIVFVIISVTLIVSVIKFKQNRQVVISKQDDKGNTNKTKEDKNKVFNDNFDYLDFEYKSSDLDRFFTQDNLVKKFSATHYSELLHENGSYDRYETLFSIVHKSNIFGLVFAANYIEKNIPKDQGVGSKVFVSYFQLYKQLIDFYVDNNLERYDQVLLLDNNFNPKDPLRFKIFQSNVEALGMKLDYSEHSYFINYNFDFLKRLFDSKVTADISEYIEIMIKVQEKPFEEDAGMQISKQALFQRILTLEIYITNYPSGYFNNFARNDYAYYIQAAMFGLDNSPVFDDNGYLMEDHKKFLWDISQRFSHTKSGFFFSEYLTRLEQNNFTTDYSFSTTMMDYIKANL